MLAAHANRSEPSRPWSVEQQITRLATAYAQQNGMTAAEMATPYRVDSRGRPTAASYSGKALTASVGVVSTVRDLARFDMAK